MHRLLKSAVVYRHRRNNSRERRVYIIPINNTPAQQRQQQISAIHIIFSAKQHTEEYSKTH